MFEDRHFQDKTVAEKLIGPWITEPFFKIRFHIVVL